MKSKKSNNDPKAPFLRRLLGVKRGQAIVLIAIAMVSFLGAAAILIDVARVYFAYQQLQAATQQAALAGASELFTGTASQAISAATSYSGLTGDQNAQSNLTSVTMMSGYPKVKCLTSIGVVCTASPADANAIVVEEQAVVPTTFAKVFGVSSWTVTSMATAAAKSGYSGPYNVEIILDTTASMNNTDSDPQCNNTRLKCAQNAILNMLKTMYPCQAGLTTCGTATTLTPTTGANVANPVDEVGLLVFPGLSSTAQVTKDTTCPTSTPQSTGYNNSPVYEIVPLSSDYRTSDTSGLNSSSGLIVTLGGGTCSGVMAPGGQSTFFAGAIDAAQALLVANSKPLTKNVMILVSDGAANSPTCTTRGCTDHMGPSPASPYPATQECHQAITRAQVAAAAGTIVYSVAYGATAAATDCSTDSSPSITPCQTMQQIASSPSNFFSDYTATGGSSTCVSASRPTSGLNTIFQEIGSDFTLARLIPNTAT
ncbi:MAG: pilus assembly protein TadG-related protein [Candidatus Binataceae bacterium]|jgi:Flp pilus assembly protein TadG